MIFPNGVKLKSNEYVLLIIDPICFLNLYKTILLDY